MKRPLAEIAWVFFRLGCIAFGGPAAHIAMMEEEIVKKRGWMKREHFLDLVGATNLIPGPNSTEMTMHCGYERGGWPGLFIAGSCFIFPAVVITGFFAWIYGEFGHLPNIGPFFFGIKPAVLAIIASAILKLGKKALKNYELAVLGILVLALALSGVHEVLALLGAGAAGAIYFYIRKKPKQDKISGIFPFILLQSSSTTFASLSTLKIFWTFLKVGAVLYGSGYVLFAYLDAELVMKGWMTRAQLLDAIAVGQFTPGPVLSTATFIGYQLGGFSGALAATAGIFLPSFLFVLILNPFIPKMRKSLLLSGFLDSVNVAAVAVMLAVLIEMGIETLTDWRSIAIAVASAALVFGLKKTPTALIIVGGAAAGWLLLQL